MLLAIFIIGLVFVIIAAVFYGFPLHFFALWTFIWVIISVVLGTIAPIIFKEPHTQNYHLEALNDGSSLHGQFFLGSGTIDEVPSFSFYRNDGDSFVLDSAAATQARIYYTTQVPHVEVKCYNDDPAPWVTWPVKLPVHIYCGRHAEYKFFVPQNSIKNTYRLDAK